MDMIAVPSSVVPLKTLADWNDAMEGDGQENDRCKGTNFAVCIQCPDPDRELVPTQPNLHQGRGQNKPGGNSHRHPEVDQVLGDQDDKEKATHERKENLVQKRKLVRDKEAQGPPDACTASEKNKELQEESKYRE